MMCIYIYIERERERERQRDRDRETERDRERDRERIIYRLYRVREYCQKWSGKMVREFYYLKSFKFCAQTIVILSSEYHQMVTRIHCNYPYSNFNRVINLDLLGRPR